MQKKFGKNKKENGVALLFAIMMTAALLMVAFGIAQISAKEITFSIESRDSMRAFFAADTGIECAMYMDSNGAFATSSSSTQYYCHNTPVVVYVASSTSFNFPLPIGPSSCAMMYINKAAPGIGTTTQTSIESYGYNVGQQAAGVTASPWPVCVTSVTNLNIVNRSLKVNYVNP